MRDGSETTTSATDDSTAWLEQYKTWSVTAKSLVADDEIIPLRFDTDLVYKNLKAGIAIVMPYRQQLATDMASVSFDNIGSLTGMCQALVYADKREPRLSPPKSTDANETFSQGHKIRTALFNKLVVAADEGLIDEEVVEAIRHGRGVVDMASDNLALAEIFSENPAVAARVNVSVEQIKTATDVGQKILEIVNPKRFIASTDAAETAQRDAASNRDRIWTLVDRTWERNVWRAGACIFGRDVEKHIPLLGSGSRTRKHVEPAPPAPAPTPTPAPVAPTSKS